MHGNDPHRDTVTDSLSAMAGAAVKQRRQVREAPGPHFRRVADMWTAITGYDISAEQVCLMMVGLKIAREAGAHDHDNLVDAIGYLELVQEVYHYNQNYGNMLYPDARPEPPSADFRVEGNSRHR